MTSTLITEDMFLRFIEHMTDMGEMEEIEMKGRVGTRFTTVVWNVEDRESELYRRLLVTSVAVYLWFRGFNVEFATSPLCHLACWPYEKGARRPDSFNGPGDILDSWEAGMYPTKSTFVSKVHGRLVYRRSLPIRLGAIAPTIQPFDVIYFGYTVSALGCGVTFGRKRGDKEETFNDARQLVSET